MLTVYACGSAARAVAIARIATRAISKRCKECHMAGRWCMQEVMEVALKRRRGTKHARTVGGSTRAHCLRLKERNSQAASTVVASISAILSVADLAFSSRYRSSVAQRERRLHPAGCSTPLRRLRSFTRAIRTSVLALLRTPKREPPAVEGDTGDVGCVAVTSEVLAVPPCRCRDQLDAPRCTGLAFEHRCTQLPTSIDEPIAKRLANQGGDDE
jgi:hypothetical protein